MTENTPTSERGDSPRMSRIECDLVAGPLRCIARLAMPRDAFELKAVWRNETGRADYTAARSAS